ncbi:exocyst complex subunit [Scheffersomyces stipitis CBS 6054]|uniref:Exocyst complex subunit n=1 Tax=Scheffersomyces stipitis (strain ATCC 58785 / CBS 6054 / NBRC 10063 / NRRL Y-11545) TaxID=322104 RepID=A3LNE6_PICST|nr:exocyst complex subunit [Scheffersomyces stipitis CBS 6054]ABN64841.2 exocyst complex subunit [Scheffersomyces stipitis CBS 6054]
MSDQAIARIAHLIKVEDDLTKIASFRQQFVKEKQSVDVKLSSATSLQIDSIMGNLSKLNSAAVKINAIKSNINKVNSIYDDSITNIKDYDTIRKMTSVNQFLTQVNSLCYDIRQFRDHLLRLDRRIEEELEQLQSSLTYTLPNLFSIHYELTQARNFSEYLEVYSRELSDDFKSIIYKIIDPIKRTIGNFQELLGEAIISLTEVVKDGNVQLVHRVVKIVEYESNEDLKFSLMQSLGLNQSRDVKTIDYASFRGRRRNYRKFFYDKLEENLSETFNACINHFSEDRMLVYENLDWLEDELTFITQRLAPLFPASWEVDTFIKNVYYNKLHKFTMEVINTDPPAEDLMKILAYDSHYSRRKSVIKQDQRSIIGEDLKNVVLEDYLKVITLKMEEWNVNLMKQETTAFTLRATPPDLYNYSQIIEDEDIQDNIITLEVDSDIYVLPDFKTPLTMLKEQADVAADSGYSKILVGVLEHWSHNYIKRIINYQQIIEEEFDKYMSVYNNERFLLKESKTERLFRRRKNGEQQFDIENMTQEELEQISKPGLIEYLTALGNTFEINTDRLQDKFLPNYLEKVHTSYHGRIKQAFEETLTPSTELNAQVIRTVVDIIVNDLYPALSSVFTKGWYDEGNTQTNDEPGMVQRCVETIGEYMEELRGYSSYEIYSVTFNILLDTFIQAYIRIGYENILHGSGKKIDPTAVKKYKSFSEGIGRDVTVLYGSLEGLFTRKDSAYLLNSLRAIEYLGDLGTCSDPLETIPDMWEHEILSSFYYCSVEYVRGICLCRKDMDKNDVHALVLKLTDIQKRYQASVDPPAMPTGTLNGFIFK